MRRRPGYQRLQSFDSIREGTPDRPPAGSRIGHVNNMIKTFNAVKGSAAAWGRAGAGAALRGAAAVFGAATGPVGVVISEYNWNSNIKVPFADTFPLSFQ